MLRNLLIRRRWIVVWCPGYFHLWEIHFHMATAGRGSGTFGAQHPLGPGQFVNLLLGAVRVRFRQVAQAVAFA